jgi:hypothetical protein
VLRVNSSEIKTGLQRFDRERLLQTTQYVLSIDIVVNSSPKLQVIGAEAELRCSLITGTSVTLRRGDNLLLL